MSEPGLGRCSALGFVELLEVRLVDHPAVGEDVTHIGTRNLAPSPAVQIRVALRVPCTTLVRVRIGSKFLAACAVSTSCGACAPAAAPPLPPQPSGPPDLPPSYLAPSDFHGGELTMDLPAAPSGKSLLLVVPAMNAATFYVGTERVTVSVEPLNVSANTPLRPVGHALPDRSRFDLPVPIVESPHATLPNSRTFKINSRKKKTRVEATGHLAHVGQSYAYYEDTRNASNLTSREYATLDGRLRKPERALLKMFGPPTDLDANGYDLVFFSRTAADESSGDIDGYVQVCDLVADSGCNYGEIIYLWPLDALAGGMQHRDYYAGTRYPAVVLHETVHLTQAAAMLRSGAVARTPLPDFYFEGQSSLMDFVSSLEGPGVWERLRPLLVSSSDGTAYGAPYTVGGLYFWWLYQAYGPSLQRQLLTTYFGTGRPADPMQETTNVPEALEFAMFYASLRLDETAYGRRYGLDFPLDDVPRRLGSPMPSIRVAPGESQSGAVSYTGHAAFEVIHSAPIHVALAVSRGSAYVLVAQP
jgi:hypothetical protein